MSVRYFSDRERGPKPRVEQTISEASWGGIVALVRSLISTGAFGDSFPDECPDGRGPVGTNEQTFQLALRAELPEVPWPLRPDEVPPTLAVLDMVEFCYHHVAKPEAQGYHSFFDHNHLAFDRDEGRRDFRARID